MLFMGIPFVIDANSLNTFQECRRKYLLSSQWRSLRWHNKSLLDYCLRQGIFQLSNGGKLEEVASEAKTRYMTIAAQGTENPDGVDPYQIALDQCALIETVLEALSRRTLFCLKDVPSARISDEVEWSFLATQDDSGTLHRWVTCSSYDDDFLTRELHSWRIFGDCCAAKQDMKLHVIVIGSILKGRRESYWTRAYQHSHIRGKVKFSKKGGAKLEGDWSKIYLSQTDLYDARSWVDLMEQDQILDTLIHEVEVSLPALQHQHEFRRQVKTEADQMQVWQERVENPRLVPMSRSACDGIVPCPFRPVCYSNDVTMELDGLGLYKRKT